MEKTISVRIRLPAGIETQSLFGQFDDHLKRIEEALHVRLTARGEEIVIQGSGGAVKGAERLLNGLTGILKEGFVLRPQDVQFAIAAFLGNPAVSVKGLFLDAIPISTKKRMVVPRSGTQRSYVEAVGKYDLVISIGPAGTGKTYLAMAMAVAALTKRQVSRIILARPAVEAGEKLGFLPGDMYAKINPYLRPLYDALYDMMEVERANRCVERGEIEIAPLAYMRGRTLNDSFVILDEAQNATSEQMKMFVTRLGFNSKAVVTGDITQVDLPTERTSGLIEIQEILGEVPGIKFVYFTEKDVVRHRLVQEIIKAYDRYEGKVGKGKRK
ncbi:MAG: PhoH family protein [Nitrospirae bacterium]|nr:PhoH family protein [Nitrospirota bacterium]